MNTSSPIFQRTELLVGSSTMNALARTRVILFGTGGVGAWCAESLVRTGIGHLTLVDSDCVCTSNINRQLPATTSTVGLPKVEVLRDRLLDISPETDIAARRELYTPETADSFGLEDFDYVVDAIDSLENKAHLLLRTCETPATLFSSMGAALKMDPTRIAVAEFWKVKGCPLAAALRRRFKRDHTFPKRKFRCVYSEELLKNAGAEAATPETAPEVHGGSIKARTNGTVAHATAIFGFTLAGLVVQDVWNRFGTKG